MEIHLNFYIHISVLLMAVTSTVIYLNPGCNKYETDGSCFSCSKRFYMDGQGICQPVNPNCDDYDSSNGDCTTCYASYTLIEGVCLPEFLFSNLFDPYCNKFEGTKCVKCSKGYYFNDEEQCTQTDPNCKEVQENKCFECYSGYQLEGNKCVLEKVQNKDPNCNKFQGKKCVKCSFGFYFNDEKKCTKKPDQCQIFNEQEYKCESCYSGYELDQYYKCVVKVDEVSDPHCNKFEDGKCVKCSNGFYFDDDENCAKIPDTCRDFRIRERKCYECYSGYELDEKDDCVVKVEEVSDPNCHTFKDGVCQKCSFGFFFDENKKCIQIPDQCQKYDSKEKKCYGCYPGYELNNFNQCIEKDEEVSDPNCNEFKNGKCVKCSGGFYFNKKKICIIEPSQCKKFNREEEKCQECYDGYEVQKGKCELTPEKVNEIYCKKFENDVCVECASQSFLSTENSCKLVDPLCKTYNKTNGKCTTCFGGYDLEDGTCQKQKQEQIDPYCKIFDGDDCQECSYRYFKNKKGRCEGVNPQCKTYNEENGECQSCFVGFKIQFFECVQDTNVLNDPNCAKWIDGFCSQCSKGSFFHESGKCEQLDVNCKESDEDDGSCLSCYIGFKLKNKKCVEDKDFSSTDQHCKRFQKGICLQCSQGYYFEEQHCKKVSDLCKTYSAKNGKCLSCFVGFKLNDSGECRKEKQTIGDKNCAKFKDKKCQQCSKGFYFNEKGQCTRSNLLCKSFNKHNGHCTTCYGGYQLKNGQCMIKEDDSSSLDSLCAEWIEGVCIKCSERSYFGEQGTCKLVDKDCKAFSQLNGKCKSCYGGYKLQKGKCIEDKEGSSCLDKDQEGFCKKCIYGYFLNDEKDCSKIDDYCAQFDYDQKECKGCYSGYSLLYGKCQITKVEEGKQIQDCFAYTEQGDCFECFERYYLKERNVCEEVDVLCKTYDKKTGDCSSCYQGFGFQLDGGKCLKD